ncbi:hypothetical protein TrLO_g13328 [Triparma laevis f. longispina]|uniref:RRM domain-containing protein n=1 Tax=Triparma laevis f. longispina TaxID=1714387 RepID=A0A9W7FVB8_9STRA|nr:hypothetical protein TrLO_g13328 [Triparma laevis f. longispina]
MSKVTNPTIDDKGGANSKGSEVEVPNPQLYAYNLNVKVTNENLKEHFGSWGDIELAKVRVRYHKPEKGGEKRWVQKSKGWGVVKMASARVVQNAIDKLNGTKLKEKFKSGKRWLAALKDQTKIINYLTSLTLLMRLCQFDGKLEEIKKILEENPEAAKEVNRQQRNSQRNSLSFYCQNEKASPEGLEVLVEAHPEGLKNENAESKRNPVSYYCQYGSSPEALVLLAKSDPAASETKDVNEKLIIDYISNSRLFEGIIGDRSLGRDDALHETMMAAFRESNVKGLQSAVENFGKQDNTLDLFAWQQFLQIHHHNNPDPGYFVLELQLLFEATWTVLTQVNSKTDEASKTLTANLKKSNQKFLQKLIATKTFRALLNSYMRSDIIYIYYFDVFLYVVFTAIFTWLSVKFKFSTKATGQWDDIVIRDMTIACFSLALYFLLRKIAQFHAIYQLGLQKNWYKDFWNYIDLVASGRAIVLLEYFSRVGPGPEYEHFASVTAMFVWMKVLGFAKAFSQPIATFVLMLSTIFRDLFSFMSVLVIILVMFGHAFFLVIAGKKEGEGDEIDFSSIGGTAWSLYLMILGTFESSVFPGIWAESLFLCYSFLVVIILLNALIAIVSDSYDVVLVTSTELFWRNRFELVAELTTTFKWLLQDLEVWNERLLGHYRKWKERLNILYGFDEDHAWSNGKHKVALGLRALFSLLLLGLAIALFFLWFLPLACEDASNKQNKCLLFARILFSPLLLAGTILFLLMWFLPYSILATILGERNSTEVDLDLKFNSSSTDWSGRVLDIVRRVNAITSSESSKTNAKISYLKAENASLKTAMNEGFKKMEKENEELKGLILKLIDLTTSDDDVKTSTVPDQDQDNNKDSDPPKPPPRIKSQPSKSASQRSKPQKPPPPL